MPWQWSSWASLGGTLTSAPAALPAANGRLVVLWRGADNALWHRWQDPDFAWRQPPMSLADDLIDSPAAVLAENGRLVVFWRGPDNALWHRWQDPDFAWRQPPMSLGGELTAAPAAVLTEIRRLGVFWRGPDNALWHRSQDREFGWPEPPVSLGGQLTSGPAAARAQDGGLTAFVRGTDNAIWYRQQTRPFLWGAATAGRQNEGGLTNDDWEIFTTNPMITARVVQLGQVPTPPQNYNPRPAGDAVRHANLSVLNQDLERARLLGMNAYRFSIEWSRIEPTATGGLRRAPLDDYYVPAIRSMIKRGLEPVVTLNHLSLPSWVLTPPVRTRTVGFLPGVGGDLADPGFQGSLRGWMNRDTVDRYIAYVKFVVGRLVPEGVRYWITLNEPVNSMIGVGYLAGVWPPGLVLEGRGGFDAYFNLLRAHVQAFDEIKRIDPAAQVSIAHNIMLAEPATPGDEGATRQLDYFYHWHFLDALTTGNVDPKIDVFHPGSEPAAAFFGLRDWSPKLDFVGVNYYRKAFVEKNVALDLSGAAYAGGFPKEIGSTTGMTSDLNWSTFPAGLGQVLRRLHERYGLPIMITENGTSEGEDRNRGAYIVAHLKQIQELNATPRGPRTIGYLYWTLVDNWEWNYNYEPRAHFGLYNVDRSASDQPRRLTDGALALRYMALGAPPMRAKERFGAIADDGASLEAPTKSPGALWQGPIDDGRPFALYLTRPTPDGLSGMLFDGTIGAWLAVEQVTWDPAARSLTLLQPGREGVPQRRFAVGVAANGDLSGFLIQNGAQRDWRATRMWLDGLWTTTSPLNVFALSFTSKWERSGPARPEAWRGKRLLPTGWSLFDRVNWDGTTLKIDFSRLFRRQLRHIALTATLAPPRLTGTVASSDDPRLPTGTPWEAIRAPDEVLQ
jgi:beta-glucosidase